MCKWFVVETESNGERHFHYVFTRTAKGAAGEAREREWQAQNCARLVEVVSVQAHEPTL